jgi:hypothetical protein
MRARIRDSFLCNEARIRRHAVNDSPGDCLANLYEIGRIQKEFHRRPPFGEVRARPDGILLFPALKALTLYRKLERESNPAGRSGLTPTRERGAREDALESPEVARARVPHRAS